MQTRKRTLLMVLLLLAYVVGGAIINVAVAWGLALFVPFDRVCSSHTNQPNWGTQYFMANYALGSEFVAQGHMNEELADRFGISSTPADQQSRRWSRSQMPMEYSTIDYAESRGWPMRACQWLFEVGVRNDQIFFEPKYAIVIDGSAQDMRLQSRTVGGGILNWQNMRVPRKALPLLPWWPGFAINTIFYAAILWLPFAGVSLARRRIRARRGQCPACAYPVGASEVCTECGRPVTPRA